MKKHNFIFGIILLFLFFSCSSKDYFIFPEYRDIKISQATLIIPTIDEIKIYHHEELFNEAEVDLIKKTYSLLLSGILKDALKTNSTFYTVNYVALKQKPEFETKIFELDDKERIRINLPKSRIAIDTSEAVFILFLQDLNVAFSKEEKETSDPAKHYSVSTTPGNKPEITPRKPYNYYFTLELKYSIYDNNAGKVVSYGLITNKQKYEPQMSVENMMREAIMKFAKKIIDGTPFET